MSEDNKNQAIAVAGEKFTDLTPKQLEQVQKFVDDGLPGIGRIDESKMRQIMDLYLSGKTYTDIANISRTHKVAILYLSHKFDWPTVRHEYLVDLENNMKTRVLTAKTESQDFMLKLVHMWQTKIGAKINEYLASGNEEVAKSIDLKEVDKYLKTVEMLDYMNSDKTKTKGPLVGINTGEGVTVKKTGENSIEITPNSLKEKTVGDILKKFADAKRKEQEMAKSGQKTDIVKKELENKGDPINEND